MLQLVVFVRAANDSHFECSVTWPYEVALTRILIAMKIISDQTPSEKYRKINRAKTALFIDA